MPLCQGFREATQLSFVIYDQRNTYGLLFGSRWNRRENEIDESLIYIKYMFFLRLLKVSIFLFFIF